MGYEEGGQLTEAVRRRPYAVILFDEIEKAHQDVFNIFLQILDEGRLTDSKGRVVDFKNALIIMTSNIGTSYIGDVSIPMEKRRQGVEQELKAHFKPEFLNRIDETIIFQSLSKENMLLIVDIQLQRLNERLQERKITLHIRQSAKQFLVDVGYNPVFGARPLKRAIQHYLEDPLAMEILEGRFTEGDHILVEADSNGISFARQQKS